jgi:nitroreductase
MNILELITSRRTIHDYTRADVDEALVDQALLAAHHAPAHKMTWPWRFTKLTREARRPLLPLAIKLKFGDKPISDAIRAKVEAKFLNPAWLVIVSQVRCADPQREHENYAAIACAVQNFSLYLHAHGVGSKWGTGAPTRAPATYELFNIDPNKETIAGFLWAGHAAKTPCVSRPALDTTYVRSLT